MNRPIAYILLLVLLGWLIGMGWCHSTTCPNCTTAQAAITPPIDNTEKTANLKLLIADEDLAFETSANDNLLFEKGTCEYVTPLSEELQAVFKNTVAHLENNSNRILVLNGFFEGMELNSCTDAADLGIARAEQVKQLLLQMGAPIGQIEIGESFIKDLPIHKDSLYIGGVDYFFKELKIEETLRADKITLYFDTNSQEISLNNEQRLYFERLKRYLELNPDAKALVTGHTDDRGEDRHNIRLSRKRSEFVRDYMIDQGMSKKQIINKGLGPDYPIAPNTTREGQELNRRVEITLQ